MLGDEVGVDEHDGVAVLHRREHAPALLARVGAHAVHELDASGIG